MAFFWRAHMNAKHSLSALIMVLSALTIPLQTKEIGASLEESLDLRKISEYWKEKDYQTVKVRILDFLAKNPNTSYADQLHAMLGDLYFREKNYAEAVVAYDKIQGKEFRLKCQFQRLHSLYETGKTAELIASSELFLKDPNAKADQINAIHFELAEVYFAAAHAPENQEKKKELMKEALAHYQQLMHTTFCDVTLVPQAQIYAFLEEYPKATSLYQLLAQKEPNKREEWLFQAGCFQLHFDKRAAIATFTEIAELGGKNASKAAFNQLNLLFQEKLYKEYILAQEQTIALIPTDKLPLVRYYLGKSLLQMHDFTKAIDPLLQCLASKTLDRVQEKSALIGLIYCAKEVRDIPLFEKALAHLKAEFANAEELPNILLMHSQLCRDKKEWTKARADIKELLEHYPNHPQCEALLYDNALLCTLEEKWFEGAAGFETFLKAYPQSAQHPEALRHLVNCRIEDLNQASVETHKVKQELLLQALIQVLEDNKSFSAAEKQKMRLLLGKTQFELGQYDEAIGTLSEYTRDYKKDSSCTQAYLLIAYSYSQGSHDDVHFVINAEKALVHDPYLPGATDLHLTLFNICLGLTEKAPAEEKAELIAKAASHLFLALDKPVSTENQRWLASYYFQQYQLGHIEAAERAAIVLEKMLGIYEEKKPAFVLGLILDREAEVLKLADIYEKTGRMQERTALLEALVRSQQTQPGLTWKYQRMAQFELAKTYQTLKQNEKALQTYNDLIASSSHTSSYFALAAQVEKAKLEFSLLDNQNGIQEGDKVNAICDALKNVELKRKLHSEPLHLEAALCYVDVKTQLAAADQRVQRRLFLLEKMKENFSSKEDPLVDQYLAAALQFPEKERLYLQYLAFVDAEMLRLNAILQQNTFEMKKASTTLEQLLAESTEEALKERIRASTEASNRDL